ncbi:MAG: acetyl-CoA C-acyltransferase [Rhodoplanes sp.]|uniref:acetyl-CoA C-acyltransferase n=1 Tax=Rhodoplanes sp. TaxID=1968906 RepID=UPI0017E19E5D|nr:acetyl-CoA C-acyltransferase [Rhodoplanes sp.]NVO17606.1 acetyl-CoA C-acyltransferase [Rhodoplanes sp.]
MPDAFVYDHVRTPSGRGAPDGTLRSVTVLALAATVLAELKARNRLDPGFVDDIVLGCVDPVGECAAGLVRAAAIAAGLAAVPGLLLDRFGASGLDAVNLAAAAVMAGQHDMAMAGGVGSASRSVPVQGALAVDPSVALAAFHVPPGIAADLIATRAGLSRSRLDAFAVESHVRATAAWADGRFRQAVAPVRDVNGITLLTRDETVQADAALDTLAAAPPSFAALGEAGFDAVAIQAHPEVEAVAHMHHAGNSATAADGAGAVLIGNRRIGRRSDLRPRARMRAFATVATEPRPGLDGTAEAIRKALRRARLIIADIDVIEIDEVFAGPTIETIRTLGPDPMRVNPNGGAIALGRPLGAVGAIMLGRALDELERRDRTLALIAATAAAGMATAAIIERV